MCVLPLFRGILTDKSDYSIILVIQSQIQGYFPPNCYILVIVLIHSALGKGCDKGNTKGVIPTPPKAEIAYKLLAMLGEMVPCQ